MITIKEYSREEKGQVLVLHLSSVTGKVNVNLQQHIAHSYTQDTAPCPLYISYNDFHIQYT